MSSTDEYEQQRSQTKLSRIDMKCLDGNIIQIKLDLSNFRPGDIIEIANTKFLLTEEKFLQEINEK